MVHCIRDYMPLFNIKDIIIIRLSLDEEICIKAADYEFNKVDEFFLKLKLA